MKTHLLPTPKEIGLVIYVLQITATNGTITTSAIEDSWDIGAIDQAYAELPELQRGDRLILRKKDDARTIAEWRMSSSGEITRLL